jgi:hypothetical protein
VVGDGETCLKIISQKKKQMPTTQNLNIPVCPSIPSTIRPGRHDETLPISKPPEQWTLHEEEPTITSTEHKPGPSCSSPNPEFLELTLPHLVSQSELNYLETDLNVFENSGGTFNISSTGLKFVTARC